LKKKLRNMDMVDAALWVIGVASLVFVVFGCWMTAARPGAVR
jgi:hypothetical protein